MRDYKFSTRYVLIVLLAFACGLSLPAQNHTQNYNIQQDNCLIQKDEKVYLQLEKKIYISGEKLKYKAYVVNSLTLKRSRQSKVLYFEISGYNNTRIFSWRSNLNKGLCFGSVNLPDTISGGVYILRAYTNWMRNTSQAFYYSTPIIITKISDSELKQLWRPELATGNEINSLIPGTQKMQGIELNVESGHPDKLIVNINSKPEYLLYNKFFHLVTLTRGQIIDDTPVILKDSVVKAEISKSNIPAGILNVVLLDPFKNPVCEKLVYISPQDVPLLSINTPKTVYGKQEKVKLVLELNNINVNDTAWLSVSVTEKTPFESIIKDADISSYLFLLSEVAGYYDTADSISLNTKQQATRILQTKKAYKYSTGNNLNRKNSPCPYIMEDKGFVLAGRIRYRNTEEPVINELILLSYVDSIASLKYCITDSAGNFNFLLDRSYDNKDIILQLAGHNIRNSNILCEIDNKSGSGMPVKYKAVTIPSTSEEYLEYVRNIAMVNNTYKTDSQMTEIPAIVKIAAKRRDFYGSDVYKVYPADFIELIDFRDISENILPGVKFRERRDIYYVQIYDHKNQIIMPPEATVLLNGIPFTDLSYISSLGSADIKRFHIYHSRLLFGDLTFYGLLSIQTYDKEVPDTYLENYTYVYNNKVQSPGISANNNIKELMEYKADNQPDFRHSLFWEPSLTIMGQNKAIIEFYTSELKAGYKITVQGLTSGGIPLEAMTEIEVK
ncbi:MAG: hypothetical protein JSV22_13125 [Bacteroidales bacterium]|nr:MAG: hypothetical protein JSV22_13125 [Bacteroidales bacterium]